MKKLLCLLLSLVLIISVVGCSGSNPKSTVSSYLDSFINGNPEEAYKFVKDSVDSSDEKLINNDDSEFNSAMKKAYEKITYKIVNSTIDGNTAQVETEITAPDLKIIMMEIIQQAMPLAFASAFSENSDNDSMDELMNTILIDKLKSEDLPMVTNTVKINLVKENGEWLIEMDDNLVNALTGNLYALEGIFGD